MSYLERLEGRHDYQHHPMKYLQTASRFVSKPKLSSHKNQQKTGNYVNYAHLFIGIGSQHENCGH